MRLGMSIGYSGATIELPMEKIKEADRLGYYVVWSAEAYGSDCITPLAWIGPQTQNIRLGTAIMQMPARTPAMTAMTAITLDQLSGGRVLLGLGLSGPQVVEGWHGQPYGKPLGRTREYVKIVRTILARKDRLVHNGSHYQIPYQGDDATGLGKPLKSILHGRADIPVYLASIGPKNVQLTAEIADGWLPIFFSPSHYEQIYAPLIEAGFAKADNSKSLEDFDIAPSVSVIVGDDVDACRNMLKPMLALYVGGMGAKGRNFYNDLVCRYGFADAAETIQDLYLAGKKDEAIQAVPDELVDQIALCGPKERIKERLTVWEKSPVTTMNISSFDIEGIRVMAELVLGVKADAMTTAGIDLPETNLGSQEPENVGTSSSPIEAVFELLASRLTENPNLVQQVDAIYQFNIEGDAGGQWVVDLKNDKGSIRAGETEDSECSVTMKQDDFIALMNGQLKPQMAFMQGKVKIKGNMMLATKLEKLIQ